MKPNYYFRSMLHLVLLLVSSFVLTALPSHAQEPIIKMTTSRAAGKQIYLFIQGEGSITAEGLQETIKTDKKTHEPYTLTQSTVTLKGKITSLWCGENDLTNLDVSGNTQLTDLWCNNNNLQSLDVSTNIMLTELICHDNQLKTLDVSKNTSLRALTCSDNQLQKLDVSKNKDLDILECANNGIKGAKMTRLIESLCDRTGKSMGRFTVFDPTRGNDTNLCLTTHVAKTKAKNWEVIYYDGNEFKNYAGATPENRTITFGDNITAKIGEVSFVSGTPVLQGTVITFSAKNSTEKTLYIWRDNDGELAKGAEHATLSYEVVDNSTITLIADATHTEAVAGVSVRLQGNNLLIEGITAPEVVLYNVAGERLRTSHETQLDLTDLPSGVYLVRVNGVTYKVVK